MWRAGLVASACCIFAHPHCMEGITTDAVAEAVIAQLDRIEVHAEEFALNEPGKLGILRSVEVAFRDLAFTNQGQVREGFRFWRRRVPGQPSGRAFIRG